MIDLPQFWSQFISHVEQKNNSPVFMSILKKTALSKMENDTCYVDCENLGMKMFLEAKQKDVVTFFYEWSGKKVTLLFLVNPKLKTVKKQTNNAVMLPETIVQHIQKQPVKHVGLQEQFTFENFAVSNSNQVAYFAAGAVCEKPGKIYNPFFIYGSVGVGKTHLAHAIANEVVKKDSQARILCCSSEDFTNDLIESIREKTTINFKKKYRGISVLVIDDVQFIAGKNYVQEEFYHTFNTLIRKGGQIILTSDRPPQEISRLEDRLKSRFSGGLTIDIQKPDFELRTAIVLIKAKERNIPLDIETAKIIAQNIDDVRELEGKLLEMYTKTLKSNQPLSPETLQYAFERKQEEKRGKISPADVIKNVAAYYNLRPSVLKSENRKGSVAIARQIAMYILRTTLKLTFDEVAHILKRKDHTTIMYGVDKVTALILKDTKLKEEVSIITKSLYE